MDNPLLDKDGFVRPAIPQASRTGDNKGDSSKKNDGKMHKKIASMEDLEKWKKSAAHQQFMQFIKQLNHFATDKSNGVEDYEDIKLTPLVSLHNLIQKLNDLIDQVPPIQNDQGQRFGNKAFRTWIQKMETIVDQYGIDSEPPMEESARQELCKYLKDSFGNYQRIDYGTGHELNFLLVLLGIYKIQIVCQKPAEKSKMKSASEQMLRLLQCDYFPLCRRFQLRYRLEPAGSHGVYSLDDFQYMPFLFGSAELIGNNAVRPQEFTNPEMASKYASKFMFLAAIEFIFKAKSGPFYEHSNQLWNISGVDDWARINRGLMAKYTDEVLHKFPVVQHVWFGEHILSWND